jgi:LysM repeat protein
MRYLRVVLLTLMLLALCLPTAAQAENKLTNPGFDEPFSGIDGTGDLVAEGWMSWYLPPETSRPAFSQAVERVATGSSEQLIENFLAPFTAGVYQTVNILEVAETNYTFTVDAYVWSTRDVTDPTVSVDPAQVTVEAGIDPTGGADPTAESIIWSEPVESYDMTFSVSVSAPLAGETATVFVRVTAALPRLQTSVYLDEAFLIPDAADVDTPTVEATEEAQPTEESAAVATEVPTDIPTEVPTDVPADTPTDVPTEVPTDTPTDVPTDVPTDIPTEEPTAVVEPTTVDDSGMTATAVVITALETEQAAIAQTAAATMQAVATEVATDLPTAAPTEVPPTEIVPTVIVLTSPPDAQSFEPTVDATIIALATAGQQTLEASIQQLTATPEAEAQAQTSAEFPTQLTHTVVFGDTVGALAQRYNSNVTAIIEVNELDADASIQVGQVLVIPVRAVPTATQPPVTPTTLPINTIGYVVQFGDSLAGIAQRYGTTVEMLAQLNGIVNVNNLRAGQRLIVPVNGAVATAAPPSGQRYTVQLGDSLYTIALKYGVSIRDIVGVNNIRNINLILPGQVLVIP